MEESVVQIDPENLDRECVRLPSQYLKRSYAAVEAQRDLDEAKAELDVVESELFADVRERPGKYGLDPSDKKITDKACAAAVATHPRYREALKKVNDAKQESSMRSAVVSALEVKKRTLGHLVELHGMGYFSDVKMSREGKDFVEKSSKQKFYRRRNSDD